MAVNEEPSLLEYLASRELQEQYIANATKDEYILPEDLWNHAADFVNSVERYQNALALHADLAEMSVAEMDRRASDGIAPFDRSLSIADVLIGRKVPEVALPAVDELRRALHTHAKAIEEAPSWAALVRESSGWTSIREATRKYLAAAKDGINVDGY